MNEMLIRLNKFLSQSGVASRREADKMIQEGRIKGSCQLVPSIETSTILSKHGGMSFIGHTRSCFAAAAQIQRVARSAQGKAVGKRARSSHPSQI